MTDGVFPRDPKPGQICVCVWKWNGVAWEIVFSSQLAAEEAIEAERERVNLDAYGDNLDRGL